MDKANIDIHVAIEVLERSVNDPGIGLPEEIFLFVSRLIAMVNVDLLVKDEYNRTLLSWRETEFSGAGWHVSGDIIRYKESVEERIKKVALGEIGAVVDFDPSPIAINQVQKEHATRGHFISILYSCSVTVGFIPNNDGLAPNDSGYLKWHDIAPKNLIKVHDVLYRQYIEVPDNGYFSGAIPYETIDH